MAFTTDKQTLDDLAIQGRYKKNSIFSLYNKTITSGGTQLLERMFSHPLTDEKTINERSEIIEAFGKVDAGLPFSKKEFEEFENYVRNTTSKNRLTAAFGLVKAKVMEVVVKEQQYEQALQGLQTTISLLNKLNDWVEKVVIATSNSPLEEKIKKVSDLLADKHFVRAYALTDQELSFSQLLEYDFVFRGLLNDQILALLTDIYEVDVYHSVALVAKERQFTRALALPKTEKVIDIKGVYHPSVPNAIDNDVKITGKNNVMFLTGANMAGKSTFMKSFSIAVYLAHMGFPVPAKEMTFSLHDGIFTSINVPDNLAMGYSHFYAEVLRVKQIAEEVATDKQLLIIFDELFKGTNVKDAYDGTVAIVDAFSKRNGSYIISTHIMEAGEALKDNSQLFFQYLPTTIEGSVPKYTYKLADGITDDRHGMIIIQNEKILDIIKGQEA